MSVASSGKLRHSLSGLEGYGADILIIIIGRGPAVPGQPPKP